MTVGGVRRRVRQHCDHAHCQYTRRCILTCCPHRLSNAVPPTTASVKPTIGQTVHQQTVVCMPLRTFCLLTVKFPLFLWPTDQLLFNKKKKIIISTNFLLPASENGWARYITESFCFCLSLNEKQKNWLYRSIRLTSLKLVTYRPEIDADFFVPFVTSCTVLFDAITVYTRYTRNITGQGGATAPATITTELHRVWHMY